jgi:hypothetical protein
MDFRASHMHGFMEFMGITCLGQMKALISKSRNFVAGVLATGRLTIARET